MMDVEDRPTRIFLRLVYVAVLCSATLLPFGLEPESLDVSQQLRRALAPHVGTRDLLDAARNLALFAGWGLLWVLTSRSRGRWTLLAAVLTGSLLSVSLESLQLLSSLRRSSILDVVTNTFGAAGGAACAAGLTRLLRGRLGRRSFTGVPAVVFLTGFGGAVLLEAAFPTLRHDLLPVWGGPLNRLTEALRAFEPASITLLPWGEGALFVPAGVMAVATLVEYGRTHRTAAVRTAALGFLTMVLVEIAHGAVSHPVELGPALVHGTGVAIGAGVSARWLPAAPVASRDRQVSLLLVCAYATLILAWTSRPFDLTLDPELLGRELQPRRLVPLWSYAARGDLYGVADVAKLFMLYLPLGAMLAVRPLRRAGPLRHVLPALYVAGIGELLHVVIGSRFFDMTDLLVACAGAAMGWTVIRRAGFRPCDDPPGGQDDRGRREPEGVPCGV